MASRPNAILGAGLINHILQKEFDYMFMTKKEITQDVEQWRSKGFCCFIERNGDNVILPYNEALELSPLDTYIYCSRGDVYRRKYKVQCDLSAVIYNKGIELSLE